MVKKIKRQVIITNPAVIDCACLIHDTLYDWTYVERLYNGLKRNLTPEVRLHVYTERSRVVPPHMIHHPLDEWIGIRGPKKSWWYKIQLFNPRQHLGPLMYFDLDTVITGNIDWIWQLPVDKFWSVRDFKYLFRPSRYSVNSSVMWFDTRLYPQVYEKFDPGIARSRARYHGDQDYIHEMIPDTSRYYFDKQQVKSWRWEIKDGGYDFKRKCYKKPESGTILPNQTSVLIFHGDPKPHEISDPNVLQYWY